MKSIKTLLPTKTVTFLVNICRKYDLKKYSSLKKDGLLNLILTSINNPQVSEKIRSLIKNNGTTALILKNLVDNKNEISYAKLRKEVLKDRSGSAFLGYYKVLRENFIIFEDDSTDDDIVFLPREFTRFTKEVIEKHIKDEEPEEIIITEEEEKASKEISTIDQLLYSKKYMKVESLQEILKNVNLPFSGNKTQIIERILYETKINIEGIIDSLFGKNELREICIGFDLPRSGNKYILIERILGKFPLAKPKRTVKAKAKPLQKATIKVKKEPKAMASSKAQATVVKEVKEESRKEKKPLIDQFKSILNQVELTPSNFKPADKYANKQRNLENSITTALKMAKNLQKELFRGIEIIGETSSNQPTIIVEREDEKLGVSICFFDSTGRMKAIKTKVFDYRFNYGKNLIFYIYDPTGNKFKNEDHVKLKQDVAVIYKRSKDFEKNL